MSISVNIFEKFKFNPKNYNILIIEDSKSLVNIIKNKFTDLNYNCYYSYNLTDAHKILKENNINFIFLDMNLPDGNGYEIIKKYASSGIKIFVLTSQDGMTPIK
jgi:DNA-binding response OmpR family regulator